MHTMNWAPLCQAPGRALRVTVRAVDWTSALGGVVTLTFTFLSLNFLTCRMEVMLPIHRVLAWERIMRTLGNAFTPNQT